MTSSHAANAAMANATGGRAVLVREPPYHLQHQRRLNMPCVRIVELAVSARTSMRCLLRAVLTGMDAAVQATASASTLAGQVHALLERRPTLLIVDVRPGAGPQQLHYLRSL